MFGCQSLFIPTQSPLLLHPHPWSPMKDLSFFLLKNSLAAKMKRGIRSFCNGVGSTSTLNQRKTDQNTSCIAAPSLVSSYLEGSNLTGSPLTLEEMILQLDLEETEARRAKLDDYGELQRRMSCVNNSDILRSARNALNQYPRFSLDGRDAMYRSSFRNFGMKTGGYEGGRKSVGSERGLGLPPTLAGESVVWCKPGVVAKLMGLDAVPVPVRSRHGKRRLNPIITRKQNLRRMGRHELEKERLVVGMHGCRRREALGSCSKANYCVMKPISVEAPEGRVDWQFRRAR